MSLPRKSTNFDNQLFLPPYPKSEKADNQTTKIYILEDCL